MLKVGFGEMDVADHFQTLAMIWRWVSIHDDYMLVSTSADMYVAEQAGHLGVCFEIE